MIYKNKSEAEKVELKRPTMPFIILLVFVIIGTYGYHVIWEQNDSNFIDEFYMTWISITTIGFSEVYPLDTTGKLFTVLISLGGMSSLFYILSVFMENLVTMQIKNVRGTKKMKKKLDKISDHIILVGQGRVGRLAALELMKKKTKFIIIDEEADQQKLDYLDDKILLVHGDATEDEVLISAGIKRAKGIIITTPGSATTLFISLSAKVLNPNIFVVARADNEKNREKLMRAGADRVVNPYSIGGQRLANLMINPHVIDFLESSFGYEEDSLNIETLQLPENCIWVDKSLKELNIRAVAGATILAIIRNSKPMLNPSGDMKIKRGDQLLVFGTQLQLKKLDQLASKHK